MIKNIVFDIGNVLADFRIMEFLAEKRSWQAEAARKNLLLSTHAIAMKGALEYLTPDSNGGYWSKYVGNCEIYTAKVSADGKWSVPVSLQNLE